MIYPKDIAENLKFRNELVVTCEADKQLAGMVRGLAAKDVLFFFNAFLWAEDPFAIKGLRHGIPLIRIRPIITYPAQDEFILGLKEAIRKGEDILADKSRDMLATYMVLGVFLHGWLFENHKYLITSWKEDEIDGKDDTSTHFGKLRFFLKMLPFMVQPKNFSWKTNSTYMKLQNPEGGTLTGSAASPNLASGRREDAIFMDELSKWEKHQDEAWRSASDATRCKVAVWTPRGAGNKAAELMRGDEVKNKFHLFWYKHPEKSYTSEQHIQKVKNGGVFDKVSRYVVQLGKTKAPEGCYVDQFGHIRSEWYDNECEKRLPDDIAENLDCNYLTTGNPVFDTLKCEQARAQSREPLKVGELVWKIRPIFNDFGECVNLNQLEAEFVENMNGMVKIWEEPEKDWENAYLIPADVAEGLDQGDYDSASVIKRTGEKPVIVAAFHGHLKVHEYAEELCKLGVYYRMAWVAVERNNQGLAVINQMFKTYQKLYHKEVLTKGYPTLTDRIGFQTTAHTKNIVIGNLSRHISEGLFDDPDEGFWKETLTFVNNDGVLEAQGKSEGQKCYDDRVMERAIGLWCNLQLPAPQRKIPQAVYRGWRKDWNKRPQGNLVRFV